MSRTFADFLSPVAPETFFREIFGKRPLHIPGAAGKFQDLLPWAEWNRMLSLNNYWTPETLLLYRDAAAIPAAEYCVPAAVFGDGVLRADPARVERLFADGATVIANYADTLTPALNAAGALLEEALCGYALANIYCSRGGRQGFRSHFDPHEVFAVQVAGEKRWRIYEGRVENPVKHEAFMRRPPGFDEATRKGVLVEVDMRPGDVLYIPRGQYHDATASSATSLHVTYGVQLLNGLDVVGGVLDRALGDAFIRADLPLPGGDESQLTEHLARVGERLAAIFRNPDVVANVRAAQRARRGVRGAVRLPFGEGG